MRELGAEVFGISVDSYASHAEFRKSLRLPFDLLSDWDREVSRKYGAFNIHERVANRLTFLIDKKGVVRYKQRSGLNEPRDIKEILKHTEVLKNEK